MRRLCRFLCVLIAGLVLMAAPDMAFGDQHVVKELTAEQKEKLKERDHYEKESHALPSRPVSSKVKEFPHESVKAEQSVEHRAR